MTKPRPVTITPLDEIGLRLREIVDSRWPGKWPEWMCDTIDEIARAAYEFGRSAALAASAEGENDD